MNRYMSYQYSNNNFSYASPASTTTPVAASSIASRRDTSTTASLNSSSQYISASGRFKPAQSAAGLQQSNKLSTSGYKSSRLPWSSSLASNSRYPSSTLTRTNFQDSSTTSQAQTQLNKHDKATAAISSTISGRSLFDYSGPRTAINTPASRIYDGQLRRTVTARYSRVTDPIGVSGGGTSGVPLISSTKNSDEPELKQKQTGAKKDADKTSSLRNLTPTKTQSLDKTSNGIAQTDTCQKSSNGFAKPLRSHSLKLRTSYTNILDQLTSTTLAKLRLGGGGSGGDVKTAAASSPSTSSTPNSSSQSSLFGGRTSTNRPINNHGSTAAAPGKPNRLDVVPDEPEEETEETPFASNNSGRAIHYTQSERYPTERLLHLKAPTPPPAIHKTNCDISYNVTTVSPNSSSSGLSSSGIACSSSGAGGCGDHSGGGGGSSPAHSSLSSYRAAVTSPPPKHRTPPTEIKIVGHDASCSEHTNDSGHSDDDDDQVDDDDDNSSEPLSHPSRASSKDQDTLVSPVNRRLSYLNKELGFDKNNLACRDNLAKTGAILAELDKFDEDSDQIERSASVELVVTNGIDQENQGGGGLLPAAATASSNQVNESELVLKPKPTLTGTRGVELKQQKDTLNASAFEWYDQQAPTRDKIKPNSSANQVLDGPKSGNSSMLEERTEDDEAANYADGEDYDDDDNDDDDNDDDEEEEEEEEDKGADTMADDTLVSEVGLLARVGARFEHVAGTC